MHLSAGVQLNSRKKVFHFWWRPFCFFLVFTWIREKSVPFLVKTFFFFLVFTWFAHLKKSWSRFIPPNVENRGNSGKIASYPPQCSTKICTLGSSLPPIEWVFSYVWTPDHGFGSSILRYLCPHKKLLFWSFWWRHCMWVVVWPPQLKILATPMPGTPQKSIFEMAQASVPVFFLISTDT